MTTDYKATPEQWADVESWAAEGLSCYSCILELRSRLEALEAGATCPHIVTSDEGTSYCGLAEQTARIGQSDVPANTSAQAAPVGSLVEKVAIACAKPCNETWDDQARAAIREVAEWLRGHHPDGDPVAATVLEREARR